MTGARSRRPAPVVLAAPSGAGKTTIAHALVDRSDDFVFSISATTRAPRAGERDGRDYEFVTREDFQRMIAAGDLVEWAEVHGHLYGTPLLGLERARDEGKHPILDIDVQGARQIRERIPEAVLIFVLPPSAEALKARLVRRGTEGGDEMRRRLLAALDEVDAATEFDHVVVNERLDDAVARVRAIARGEERPPKGADGPDGEVGRIREEIGRVLQRLEAPGETCG